MHRLPAPSHRSRDPLPRPVTVPRLLTVALLLALSALSPGLAPAPAHAASGTREVTDFGPNPGNLRMFRHVPDGLPAGRPLVVALHGCGKTAGDFDDEPGWTEMADKYGFALLLPEQKAANNALSCFNWFEPGDTTRGRGEARSIKQMVDRITKDQGSDPSRVYVTGLSAGSAMTAVMAATYPDVFAGAAMVAGAPYGCARNIIEAVGCATPGKDLTPRQWGDKVRAAHPGHGGRWPTVSVWHGTEDTAVAPMNMTEVVEQWTDVHGTDTTPEVSDQVQGYPHKVYRDRTGQDVVESYSITGMGHGQPVDPGTGEAQCGVAADSLPDENICAAYRISRSWGLNK
ncbi:alpha/beta hydrolase family esterase [Streptomyces sp. NPDC057302]|uniref:extracellular catalytic domain type 1 short-chain-length polyhydroxyalkanoate depolymerase n=1 Tax=Streptomyces sp. NPDC057302 TaxID=3346094 RepID=UPI003633B486